MIIIQNHAYIDQKEDTPELRLERITKVKAEIRKVVWQKYHKDIKWDIREYKSLAQTPLVLCCIVDAKIDI